MSESLQTTRRNLLRVSLASATAAMLPVGMSRAAEWNESQPWDVETDVVVVGYGAAGAAAAIEARTHGAEVLVLEKMLQGGGNTASSGGGFIIPSEAEGAFEYLSKTYAFADNDWDPELVRAFCQGAVGLHDYFAGLSPDIRLRVYGHANYPELPKADTITKYGVRGRGATGGQVLFNTLSKCAEERGVEVRYGTPAKQLISRKGEVIGVVALHEGKELRIRARRGVVLATGGFEYNEKLLRNYAQGTHILGLGNPGNTGDGLLMAMSMGAELWHMTSYSCSLGIPIPGKQAALPFAVFGQSYIVVDQSGKRFINEAGVDFHAWLYGVNKLDTVGHKYPAIPCYVIFDEATLKAGPLTYANLGYATLREGVRWSKDGEEEIKAGIIKKADSIEELAHTLKIPADALGASVKRWNETIAAGDDPDFGRRQKKPENQKSTGLATSASPYLSLPLAEKGPYYAIELYPTLLNSQGGPKRTVKAEVLSTEGKPIPRLYAAGELGSIWGTIYQGSSNIAECLVFGRIAGRSAAAESAWS